MSGPSLRQQIEELQVFGTEHAEICKVAVYRGKRSEREIAYRRARFDAILQTMLKVERNIALIKHRCGDDLC